MRSASNSPPFLLLVIVATATPALAGSLRDAHGQTDFTPLFIIGGLLAILLLLRLRRAWKRRLGTRRKTAQEHPGDIWEKLEGLDPLGAVDASTAERMTMTDGDAKSFKEENEDLQRLSLELMLVRQHNLSEAIRLTTSDQTITDERRAFLIKQQQDLLRDLPSLEGHHRRLIFAEGALVLITMERFLRLILKRTGAEHRSLTLPNLLEEATGERTKLLEFQPTVGRDKAIKMVTLVRNTLLHGNYEQLAAEAHCTVKEFFKEEYLPAVEGLYQLLDFFMKQINPATGKRT